MVLSHEDHPAYRETALPTSHRQQPGGCPGPYLSRPWPAGQHLRCPPPTKEKHEACRFACQFGRKMRPPGSWLPRAGAESCLQREPTRCNAFLSLSITAAGGGKEPGLGCLLNELATRLRSSTLQVLCWALCIYYLI